MPEIIDIRGLGPKLVEEMKSKGIDSIEKLASMRQTSLRV